MKTIRSGALLSIQVLFFVAVWLSADRLLRVEHLHLPAGVVGLTLVSALLFAGVVSQREIEFGAKWLLAEMPLFFIPPLLSIIDFGPVFARYGISLLATVLLGSVIVMAGTGLVVDLAYRLERRRRLVQAFARSRDNAR